MVSEFGKVMRLIRQESGDSLRILAQKLNVSAAFLSALEVGKKKIPLEYIDKICEIYNLDSNKREELEDAVSLTNKRVLLSLDDLNAKQMEASLLFARKIKTADPELIQKLLMALEDTNEKN